MMRVVTVAALLAFAHVAHAFPTGEQFDGNALTSDGGGGIAFDGAPRWSNHTCAVCHTEAPGKIELRLEADKPELFTDGWRPSQQYHLRVVLLHQWAGAQYEAAGDNCGFMVMPYQPCDENGFALEMDAQNGKPVGLFVPVVNGACATTLPAPADVDVRVLDDGSAVTHNGAHMGETSWDLCWTAPAAGTGVITAFLAAVDGNGGNGTMEVPNDTVGDDVAAGEVPLAELGGAAPPPQSGGCAAAGEVGSGTLIAIGAALWFLVVRRRRALSAVVAIATIGGCVHVRPRQRETLARRNMKFAPDPAEDELDLHMQESREGSSGAYGSSGGGCGCN